MDVDESNLSPPKLPKLAKRGAGRPKQNKPPVKKEGPPTNQQIKKALFDTFGRISVVARMLKLERATIYQRIKKHDFLQKATIEARRLIVPYAEYKLMQNVADRDQRAIEFVLKNKGTGWNVNGEQETGVNDLNYVINLFQQALEDTKPTPLPLPDPTIIDIKPNAPETTPQPDPSLHQSNGGHNPSGNGA